MSEEEKDKEEKEEKEKRKMYQRVAVYSGIPMTLLSGVLVGYLVGYLLEKKFPSNNIILAISLMFGFAAGFKLVIDYIKRFK